MLSIPLWINIESQSGMSGELFAILISVTVFFALVAFLAGSYVLYFVFKKTEVKHLWMVFIPFGAVWLLLAALNRTRHFMFVILFALTFVLSWILKGFGPFTWILILIFVGLITLWFGFLLISFHINPNWSFLIVGTLIPTIGFVSSVALLILTSYIAFDPYVTFDRKHH